MKILILGASGMIGSNIYKFFFLKKNLKFMGHIIQKVYITTKKKI